MNDKTKKQMAFAKEHKWATVRLVIDRKHCEKPTSGRFWLQGATYFAAVPPFIADAFEDLINNWRKQLLAEVEERKDDNRDSNASHE